MLNKDQIQEFKDIYFKEYGSGMLPTEAYKQFKEIYLKEFGVLISDEEVVKKANDFMEMFKILVQTDQKDIDTLERVSV